MSSAAVTTSLRNTRLERARGQVRLTVRREGEHHLIDQLGQSGCGRLLFPARLKAEPLEAVIVNTSGGLTGGDRFDLRASALAGSRAVLTTQACEKIYRSSGGSGRLQVKLDVAQGARLHWLPQETILFDGSALERSLSVDVADGGIFVAAEAMVLGRAAMGETLSDARLRDSWRIRRGGRLVFAEELACAGDWRGKAATRAALGREAAAFATLLFVGPDPADRLERVRAYLETFRLESHRIDAGASVVDDLLVVRLLSSNALQLRHALMELIPCLTDAPLPRVWTI